MQIINNKKKVILKAKKIKPKKYAFNENIEDVGFGCSVNVIGESAFYGCKSLEHIKFPESIIKIENDAFSLCKRLTKIELPKSLKYIGSRCFSWSGVEFISIPQSVKEIPGEAFANCRKTKKIELNRGLKKIGENAFLDCMELTEITLPDTVEIIGSEAFKGCIHLKEVTIPDSITFLPEKAFENCRSLEKIILPKNLEAIGDSCFSGCASLNEINFPESLKRIGEKAFERCESLKSLVFPQQLQHIGSNAFSGCFKLKGIRLNNNLNYAGAKVFENTVLTLPESIKTMFCTSFLPKGNFRFCPTVIIPESVEELTLGFKGLLPYSYLKNRKTCFNHILQMKKYNIKIFISENYYSYNNDQDKIIYNGFFDFEKYDNFFSKADENEKPVIAAFRLTYPESLNEFNRLKYENEISKSGKAAAIFALEGNEEEVLKYLINNIDYDTDFCTTLYSAAEQKGYRNLQQIISQKPQKTGLNELNSLYKELLTI